MLENNKFRLPDLEYSQYELLMKALQYYRNSSVEFSVDGDVLNEVYILTTRIQEKTKIIYK